MINIYEISKRLKALRSAKERAQNLEFKALWDQKINDYKMLIDRQSAAQDYLLSKRWVQ